MSRRGGVHVAITADDGASPKLKGVEKTANSFASNLKKKFQSMKLDVISFNQAIELGKKAFQAVKQGLEATVGASLESRDATDQLKRKWEEFTGTVKQLRIEVGDMLLAAFVALADAVKPFIEQIRAWVEANKELITSALLDFIQKAIKGFAALARVVNPIVNGWRMIAAAIKGNTAEILNIEQQMLDLDHSIEVFGDEVDKAFGKAKQDTVTNFGVAVKRAMTDAQIAALAAQQAFKKAEQDRLKAIVDAQEKERQAKSDWIEHQYAQAKELEDRKDAEAKARSDKEKESRELAKAQIDENTAKNKEASRAVYETFRGSFDGVIQGTKSVGDAFAQMIERMLTNLLSSGLLSLLGILLAPITGGASAGVGVFGGGSFIGGLFGFNRGGLVPGYAGGGMVGGPSGVDRVPAMLTAGEYVIPKPIVDDIRQGKAPEKANHFASGGYVTAGGAAPALPPPSIVIGMAASGTELRKIERDHWNRARKRNERNRIK